jgi:HK97 family phage prohead protease
MEHTTEKRNAGSIPKVDSAEEKRFVEGYAALYNVRSVPELGFTEIIEQGAFDGADLSDVRMLFNHNADLLCARTKSGTLTVTADQNGLHFRGEVANTSYGNDLLELVQRGDIDQCSFAFRVAYGGDDWEMRDDGSLFRHIRKIDMVNDVSPCPYPAYTQTSIDKRSLDALKEELKNKGKEDESLISLLETQVKVLSMSCID